jgi:hypothetical protein
MPSPNARQHCATCGAARRERCARQFDHEPRSATAVVTPLTARSHFDRSLHNHAHTFDCRVYTRRYTTTLAPLLSRSHSKPTSRARTQNKKKKQSKNRNAKPQRRPHNKRLILDISIESIANIVGVNRKRYDCHSSTLCSSTTTKTQNQKKKNCR